MYEGGAAGFDRVDEWSDLDVQIIVKDGTVELAFTDLETALAALSETDYKYRLPEPTWHGHSQAFYRLKDASPFLMLDIVFIQESSETDRFMQFRTHGQPNILFDKDGLIVEEPLDEPAMIEKMKAAVEANKMRFDLYWVLTEKEIRRKNEIEAFQFYYGMVVTPSRRCCGSSTARCAIFTAATPSMTCRRRSPNIWPASTTSPTWTR